MRDKAATLQIVKKHAITHVMHLAAESHVDRSITGPGDFIQTNVVGHASTCWKPAGPARPPPRPQTPDPRPDIAFITFQRTKFSARWVRKVILPRPRRMRPTRRIRRAKRRATCSCVPITTPTVCRPLSPIARTITGLINSPKSSKILFVECL